jgi:hypothetical protein
VVVLTTVSIVMTIVISISSILVTIVSIVMSIFSILVTVASIVMSIGVVFVVSTIVSMAIGVTTLSIAFTEVVSFMERFNVSLAFAKLPLAVLFLHDVVIQCDSLIKQRLVVWSITH